jgi:hypothetical protein
MSTRIPHMRPRLHSKASPAHDSLRMSTAAASASSSPSATAAVLFFRSLVSAAAPRLKLLFTTPQPPVFTLRKKAHISAMVQLSTLSDAPVGNVPLPLQFTSWPPRHLRWSL